MDKCVVKKYSGKTLHIQVQQRTKTKKQNLKQIYRKYTENSLIKKWRIVLYFYR